MKAIVEVYDGFSETWSDREIEIETGSVRELVNYLENINGNLFEEAVHVTCKELDIDNSANSVIQEYHLENMEG
jgi:hypothetical protein